MKKTLALTLAALLVYGAVILGGAAFWASRTHVDERPYATLWAGKEKARAYPTVLCSYQMKDCDGDFLKVDPARHTRFPVPIGETVRVRLSDNVVDDPWSIVAQYLTPNGSELLLKEFAPKQGARSLTLSSTRERVLINIEISLPSALLAGDSDTDLVRRGYIAINTTPTGEQKLLDQYEQSAIGKAPKQRPITDVAEFSK
ncbi:MAG: DUF2771 family protein [Gordonia sp. (in: high G+C Gram-positive bacteria)]|uniref:DUF2771 family protein n=1 Tax=Gordonia sp. (in: high G+C Gram-positive bacteria) TaxID=84139 RepID=UPI0039E46FDB